MIPGSLPPVSLAASFQRPFGQLDRLLLSELARLFAAMLAGVVLLYLVIDFADRGSMFSGHALGRAVLELYLNQAAVVAHQLAPAALVLSVVLLVAQLGRRGELVALRALGISPWRLSLPVCVFAAGLGCALWFVGERVVVRADARAEEITAKRFHRWGDWGAYHADSTWLKGRGGRIFHLGKPDEGGFSPATVLELDGGAKLVRRLDARRMEPAGPGQWRLLEVRETRYSDGEPALAETRSAERLEAFPDTPDELSLRSGRPRQLPFATLREQAARRERLGQPSREFRLALAERVAFPLQLIPSALAAMGLLSWRGRRSGPRSRPLATAIAAGLVLVLVLWSLSVVLHAASLSGALPAWLAALGPGLVSGTLGALGLSRGR